MIPAALCLSGRELLEPDPSPDGTWVLIGTRSAGTAGFVLVPAAGGPERQVAADPAPALARGLGGGCTCWLPDASGWAYIAKDGSLRLHLLTGERRCIAEFGPDADLSSPSVSPDGSRLALVVDLAEIHILSIDDGRPLEVIRAAPDADFVIDPVWSPVATGSALAWQTWRVPHMPWDRSVVVDSDGRVHAAEVGQTQQPRYSPDGTLFTVRDAEGFLNVHRGDSPVVREPFEHAGPTWGPGQRSYAISPDATHVAFNRNEGGFGRLVVVDLATGHHRDVAKAVHGQLRWVGRRLTALRTGGRTPTQVVSYDTDTWERTVLAVGPVAEWSAHDHELVEPELVSAEAPDGTVVPARLYRPLRQSETRNENGTDTRLICWVHGGPTDQWMITFLPRVAYWVSRGWNVLVPDHRGSTGHGRTFQQALDQRWGDADVDDVAAAIRLVHQQGIGTPHRTVMMGGSAGGYVALRLVERFPELVAGAAVAYPVSDPTSLFEATHRFEAHYDHSLVGPNTRPVDPALVRRPILILHGDSDPVVPLDQSIRFADRMRAAGGDIALHVYEGEGHGFRQPANQRDEFDRIGGFVHRLIG